GGSRYRRSWERDLSLSSSQSPPRQDSGELSGLTAAQDESRRATRICDGRRLVYAGHELIMRWERDGNRWRTLCALRGSTRPPSRLVWLSPSWASACYSPRPPMLERPAISKDHMSSSRARCVTRHGILRSPT